ncbi:lactonase family protein [Streptomyces sp. NPDC048560]|uniref:lactonase family protein n=1 Tax=Streptomyces sp. NPDC048560 TaxID=3155488 RepID=UPI00341DFB18
MSGKSAGRAFIGSFTSAGGLGITAVAVDRETGDLTVLGSTDAVADPSYLVSGLGPGGAVLYAVSETSEGAAAAFDVSEDVPRLLGDPQSVRGDGPTHLTLAAGHVVTANYGSGSVTVLPVLADGSLAAAASVVQHEGGGPDASRQEAPHAHEVLADPSGQWLLSVDLGTDSVRVCAVEAATGDLRVHGETKLSPGTGPRHLAFHPAGRFAYVVGELEPTLTVCAWDAAAGVLEPVTVAAVLPENVIAGEQGRSYPSEVVVSHDGRFLWVANRGHDSISVLTLDETGEKAALAATVGCGGHWPRDLALDPSGQWLYAANERSGNVTWFAVDAATGMPSPAGSLDLPAPSCVAFA